VREQQHHLHLLLHHCRLRPSLSLARQRQLEVITALRAEIGVISEVFDENKGRDVGGELASLLGCDAEQHQATTTNNNNTTAATDESNAAAAAAADIGDSSSSRVVVAQQQA
jgi:hypothetical protein